MTDYNPRSDADTYWRDKVESPLRTLAAAFITAFIVGTSMATAASANMLDTLLAYWI